MTTHSPQLRLENQVCFPLYATSRLITQQYKPLLDELGVTYPQYLVLLVLWEKDKISIKEISDKLFLETNTLTPLLKRMEKNGIIKRMRSEIDERVVTISLTQQGKDLHHKAIEIPYKLIDKLDCFPIEKEEVYVLKRILDKILAAAKQTN